MLRTDVQYGIPNAAWRLKLMCHVVALFKLSGLFSFFFLVSFELSVVKPAL